MKRIFAAWLVFLLSVACCAGEMEWESVVVMEVAEGEILLDGRLDENAWKKGKELSLGRCPDKTYRPVVQKAFEKGVWEKSFFKLAKDRKFLYVGIRMEDSDVVAECDQDQKYLYKFGDTAEVFLKSEKAPFYWEIYAAPNGRTTVFFYPSQGRFGLPGNLPKVSPLQKFRAKVCVSGTLNDYSDKDKGWTAELAIPLDEIEKKGIAFTPENKWTFLIYRVNYSLSLPWVETTMYPNKVWNCHAFENYVPLIFGKAKDPSGERKK
ncbi:MAG: carbohydrate-binding family 9-like protein [Lentisphaeria bacterium]|nr:carbohydrate-binding family 9-like protein [Lentisphaeria bacterium]